MIVEHIDAIARKKQRSVLFIVFHPIESGIGKKYAGWMNYNYEKDRRRKGVLKWLKLHDIHCQPSGYVASENGMLPYLGNIYIDVPFDENDPQYLLVRDYLENADGTLRDKHVRFCYLPLEHAMKNAHHDEPGFWDRCAETF